MLYQAATDRDWRRMRIDVEQSTKGTVSTTLVIHTRSTMPQVRYLVGLQTAKRWGDESIPHRRDSDAEPMTLLR